MVPNIEIEIRRQYTPDQEERIIDAVHSAVVKGLKIPEGDKTIRLVVHEPHRFPAPPDKRDRYTLVRLARGQGVEHRSRGQSGSFALRGPTVASKNKVNRRSMARPNTPNPNIAL